MKVGKVSKVKIWALVAGLLLPMPGFSETTKRLSPGDNLADAIFAAQPGDVLELDGGAYGALEIKGAAGTPDLPITVRSADPDNPARLSEMDLREISHLVLEGLVFDYDYKIEDKPNARPFQVFATRGLTIRDSLFDGDVAESESPEEAAYPTGFGLSIRSSAEVLIEGNEIRDFYRGLLFSDSVDIVVMRNDIHSIRMDGMNFAQVERVLIEANVVRDFKRAIGSADHADMIQFWTNKTERPTRDVTIRNNVLNSGLGWYTQSIFMRNEEVDTGRAGREMYYRDIVVEGNVIINAHLHGISIGETDGLAVRNNTVVHNARSDGEMPNQALWTPQVRIAENSRNVIISKNIIHKLQGHEEQSDWRVIDNLYVQDRFPNEPNYYNGLFASAQHGDPRDLKSFMYLQGGALETSGLGAQMLNASKIGNAPSAKEQGRAPAIRVEPDSNVPSKFFFDLAGADIISDLDLSRSKVEWSFGDGNKGEGARVSHNFDRPGTYEVTLSIELPNGETRTSTARVRAKRPEVIEYSAANAAILSYAFDPPKALDLPLGEGPLQLGGENALITIPREAIAPLFGSNGFRLDTRIRSVGGYKSAGVVLQIYKTLSVTVGGRGTVVVRFNTETASPIELSTPPLPVLQGEWVDLGIEYAGDQDTFLLFVNGVVVAKAQTTGRLRPLEHWGLALGHPFKPTETFYGEMESLILTVGRYDRSTEN